MHSSPTSPGELRKFHDPIHVPHHIVGCACGERYMVERWIEAVRFDAMV
jgi:hypothetical protein